MPTNHNRLKDITNINDAPVVGVAVTVTNERNTHTGILYRDENDRVWLLHLRFHCSLENRDFDPSYLCAEPDLEPEDAEVVAGHCRSIARDNPPIWFAIHYNTRARIGEEAGRMALSMEGKGLNCSTFVLTVFQSAGPALVDFARWPKRASDRAWHRHLMSMLRPRVPLWYFKKVAKDIGCARVRPEEVAGACLEDGLPVSFPQCEASGRHVLRAVEGHTGRKSRW
jgi:hypothetical protein